MTTTPLMPLDAGHWRCHVTGLATHPHKCEFVTVGSDGALRMYNTQDKKEKATMWLEEGTKALCVAYAPNGLFLALGCGELWMMVMDSSAFVFAMAPVILLRLLLSPNGTFPACGASSGALVLIVSLMEADLKKMDSLEDST